MARYIRHEIKKMFMQKETWIVIAICFGIAFVGMLESVFGLENITDRGRFVFRPDYYMLNTSTVGTLYLLMLAPFIASIPCACSYFKENSSHMDAIIISRVGRNRYYTAKMIVVAVTGFVVAVLPLALQYIMCMLTVPSGNILHSFTMSAYKWDFCNDIITTTVLFPELYINYPDLSVFVHIAICGLWMMGMTMLTYTISLYFRKNIIITMVLSSAINLIYTLILDALNLHYLTPTIYFFPGHGAQKAGFTAFIIMWGILMLINVLLLTFKLKNKKDIL